VRQCFAALPLRIEHRGQADVHLRLQRRTAPRFTVRVQGRRLIAHRQSGRADGQPAVGRRRRR